MNWPEFLNDETSFKYVCNGFVYAWEYLGSVKRDLKYVSSFMRSLDCESNTFMPPNLARTLSAIC